MTSRFTELAIDCGDPAKLADFWVEVLDWKRGESGDDYAELTDPEGASPSLFFIRVPEGKSVKNRLHIDLSPRDRDQDAEVERVLGLGARRADVGQGPEVSWVVMADPEDNEFCILSTRRP